MESRTHSLVKLGISPRGALAVTNMSKARAYINGRDYVVPEDVQEVFADTCRHRIILFPKAGLSDTDTDAVLNEIAGKVHAPKI